MDDILITGGNLETKEKVKQKLSNSYRMADRGELSWVLGIEFVKTNDGTLYQKHA